MVAATFQQLITCIMNETDPSFLASLYKCFTDSLVTVGGPNLLGPELQGGIVDATKRQLQSFADKRRRRLAQAADELGAGNSAGDAEPEGDADYDDLMLLEEMEDFALEDMAKLLHHLDPNHPLLVAVASVKELGTGRWDSDDDESDSERFTTS
jgi:importin-5